jgi:hypothetical protein
LVSITDTGAVAAVTTLATAGANQMFRGVAFAPDTNVVPQVFNPSRTTNGFALAWTGLIGRNYTVLTSGDLSSANWAALTNVTLAAPTASAQDAMTTTNRFYRVILNPVISNP